MQQWSGSPPPWLKVISPANVQFLDRLDRGEASAISLAIERCANLVIIDERDGTAVARGLGLSTYGTLGVLALAGAKQQVNFEEAVDRLPRQTRFRVKPAELDVARRQFEQLSKSQ